MEKHKPKTKTNDRAFIIIGFVVIGIIFVLYSNVDDFSITKDSVQAIERLAIGFYVILLMSFGTIGYGIYRYHQRKSMENTNGILTIIAKTTMNSRSRKIFVATFIAYGMFFSLTAGLIVYQPDMIFSHHYDAVVPSAHMNSMLRRTRIHANNYCVCDRARWSANYTDKLGTCCSCFIPCWSKYSTCDKSDINYKKKRWFNKHWCYYWFVCCLPNMYKHIFCYFYRLI